jgi:hypothetical protein
LDWEKYFGNYIGHQDINAENMGITVVKLVKIIPDFTTNAVKRAPTIKN